MSLPIPPSSRYGWKGYKYGRRKRSSLSEAFLSLDFDGEFLFEPFRGKTNNVVSVQV